MLFIKTVRSIYDSYFWDYDTECLAVCFLFIISDLASKTNLEGSICADRELCHIAEASVWRQDKKTLIQTFLLVYGHMVPHHLPKHLREADVRVETASPGNLEDVWPNPGQPLHPHPASLTPSLWTDSPGSSSAGNICWHLMHTKHQHH